MLQHMSHSTLPVDQELAAQLVAEGRLTQNEIAEKLDVARNTIFRWRHLPAFTARVDQIRDELVDDFDIMEITNKKRRVTSYCTLHNALLGVKDARAADPRMADVPGGKTGLIVLEAKAVGGKLLVEAKLDIGMITKLIEIKEKVAREMGQLVDSKTELSGTVNIQQAVRLLSDEDLDRELSIYLSGTRDASQGALTGAAGDNVPATAGEESADVSAEAGS